MNEKMIGGVIAELIHAQGDALGMVVVALCQQVDPARLKDDLKRVIDAAGKLPSTSPTAIRIATHALAAAEAEKSLQAKPPGEGPHPTRG